MELSLYFDLVSCGVPGAGRHVSSKPFVSGHPGIVGFRNATIYKASGLSAVVLLFLTLTPAHPPPPHNSSSHITNLHFSSILKTIPKMQYTIVAAAALFSAAALAQEVVSAPFNLTVTSSDGKYSGDLLSSCHEGAAIESLCLGYGGSTFHQNTTSGEITSNGNGPEGPLTWLLPSQPDAFTESMQLYVDPSTNVALPLFEPTESYTGVAFDSNDLLNLPSALDDTVTPPTDTSSRAVYRWHVCEYNYAGYVYETLNWVYGNGPAQNPTCVPVDVKRVFV